MRKPRLKREKYLGQAPVIHDKVKAKPQIILTTKAA
jgi:hypothetical protein